MDYYLQIKDVLKSDLADEIKREFFQFIIMSVLMYNSTKWTLSTQRYCYWATISWNSSCTATYLPSYKSSKKGEHDMQRRTHQQCSLMDFYIYTNVGRNTQCEHWIPSWELAMRDGLLELMARKSQKNLGWAIIPSFTLARSGSPW